MSGELPDAVRVAAADFSFGAVLLAPGIGVSVASYGAASSGSGGRSVVATGLIGVGLMRLSKP